MPRIIAGLILVCLPMFCQQDRIVVRDIFGRLLNRNGITLVDWDGYIANPAIKFFVIPPVTAKFPATAVLTADEQRLYFDLPSTVGQEGPRKTIVFGDASARVPVFLGNAPDRDSSDGYFHLYIHLVDSDARTWELTLPIHEIDQDRNDPPRDKISADFSRDATGFFEAPSNRAPVQQALADWAYFFDDMQLDAVPAGRERTLIWDRGGFTSSTTVKNRMAYRGSLLYIYGIHTGDLRSGGEPSAQGDLQSSRGTRLALRRSGGVEIETAGNYNSIGWRTGFADESWWASGNLKKEQNELFSIAHHESGHALAFNPAELKFAEFKQRGCIDDPAVISYHGGCLQIDRTDHFSGEIDDASLFGAFGNEYHGRLPARRWFITKLDLLAAQAVGWKLRRTSSLIPASIVTSDLMPGIVRHQYDYKLSAAGGIPFYNWTVDSRPLPDGLRLDSFSGAISGTPTRAGHFSFTVRLQDYVEGSPGVTKNFTIAVAE